jgi:hypothetical protein
VPPISSRLKPLIPFFIAWSAITTLAVHLMRGRKRAEEEQARKRTGECAEGLAERFRAGEDVSDEDIRRELEMVGLRERTALTLPLEDDVTELRDVSWFEVFLGRRKKAEEAAKAEVEGKVDSAVSEAQAEAEAVVEWSKSRSRCVMYTDATQLSTRRRRSPHSQSHNRPPGGRGQQSAPRRPACSFRRGRRVAHTRALASSLHAYNISLVWCRRCRRRRL